MRNNGGGLLQGAVETANLLLPPGQTLDHSNSRLYFLSFVVLAYSAFCSSQFEFSFFCIRVDSHLQSITQHWIIYLIFLCLLLLPLTDSKGKIVVFVVSKDGLTEAQVWALLLLHRTTQHHRGHIKYHVLLILRSCSDELLSYRQSDVWVQSLSLDRCSHSRSPSVYHSMSFSSSLSLISILNMLIMMPPSQVDWNLILHLTCCPHLLVLYLSRILILTPANPPQRSALEWPLPPWPGDPLVRAREQ